MSCQLWIPCLRKGNVTPNLRTQTSSLVTSQTALAVVQMRELLESEMAIAARVVGRGLMHLIDRQFGSQLMRIGILMTRNTALLFQRKMTGRTMLRRKITSMILWRDILMTAQAGIFGMTDFTLRSVCVGGYAVSAFAPEIGV